MNQALAVSCEGRAEHYRSVSKLLAGISGAPWCPRALLGSSVENLTWSRTVWVLHLFVMFGALGLGHCRWGWIGVVMVEGR